MYDNKYNEEKNNMETSIKERKKTDVRLTKMEAFLYEPSIRLKNTTVQNT